MTGVMEPKSFGRQIEYKHSEQGLRITPVFVGQCGFVAGVNCVTCGDHGGSVWMSLQGKLEDREGQLAWNAASGQ